MGERVKLTEAQMIALRAVRGVAELGARNWSGLPEALISGDHLDGALRSALFGLQTTRQAIDYAERMIRQAIKDHPHD